MCGKWKIVDMITNDVNQDCREGKEYKTSSAERLAHKVADKQPDNTACDDIAQLGLLLDDFGLVLHPDLGCEVVDSADINPVPGNNSLFKGFYNHKGTILPVYDVTSLLDIPLRIEQPKSRFLIFRFGVNLVALVINELPQKLVNCQKTELDAENNLPDLFLENTLEVLENDSGVWLCLDYSKFFVNLASISTGLIENSVQPQDSN